MKQELEDLKSRDHIGAFSTGKDLKGKFKLFYLRKLIELSDAELKEEVLKVLTRWLKLKKSTSCDYFWKNNALYHECLRRGCQTMYQHQYTKLCKNEEH
jgi:hypothetical protein